MAIQKIGINDFLVFKGEFKAEFCDGVNIFIGGNGTGKTTLLKGMYAVCENLKTELESKEYTHFFNYFEFDNTPKTGFLMHPKINNGEPFLAGMGNDLGKIGYPFSDFRLYSKDKQLTEKTDYIPSTYIPEKDMLTNSKSLPETVEYGKLQYSKCDIDIIKKSRVAPSTPEQSLYKKVCSLIGGEPQNDGENFFIKREEIDKPIPFSLEASGYRKLALLATLIRNEQITSNSILFWDEPENSLNPELMSALVEILLELSENGVQIFIATHSYTLARWFDVKRKKEELKFFNLTKNGVGIEVEQADSYTKLSQSVLRDADTKLFNAVVAKSMGVSENE